MYFYPEKIYHFLSQQDTFHTGASWYQFWSGQCILIFHCGSQLGRMILDFSLVFKCDLVQGSEVDSGGRRSAFCHIAARCHSGVEQLTSAQRASPQSDVGDVLKLGAGQRLVND